MKTNKFLILSAVTLAACNSVNLKPDSMDKSELVFAQPGGYQMRHAIKTALEERGYKVVVGRQSNFIADEEFTNFVKTDTMGARYVVRVQEIISIPSWAINLDPFICLFNGYQWWTFNVSISDQKTGEELLAWTGRGCADGNIHRLNRLMDRLEKKP